MSSRSLDIGSTATSSSSISGVGASRIDDGASDSTGASLVQLPQYGRDQYYPPTTAFSSDEEIPSPVSTINSTKQCLCCGAWDTGTMLYFCVTKL